MASSPLRSARRLSLRSAGPATAVRVGLASAAVGALALLAALPAIARQDDPPAAVGDATPDDPGIAPESAEIEKERETAERFLSLLERNPRPGTALDRAYAFFAERGELAALAERLRTRAEENPADAAAPAILGLIEARRGNDEQAVAAFEQAAERAPDDPNPRARLAEAYALAGRHAQAAEAYEAALARDPSRRDLPDLLSGLGRVLTRSGQAEEADAVWDRLIEKFPGDDAVREQIAAVLEAEGDLEGALARYDALAADTTDEYRRVAFGLKAASLKVRAGRNDEAVADFEKLLANLNPDSWLFREVRSGIERAFLRTDDLAGLTAYYEGWVEDHPEDVAAMARLGELLDRQSRTAEARDWLEKAVEKAPGDGRLRRALVDQLLRSDDYAGAAKQFEELNRLAPGDSDTLRDWGSIYLDDPSLSDDERLAKAEAVWRRLLTDQSDDPVAVTQVADWLRQAGAKEPAKALYRQAIELAPEDPRYVEYLGEYLHILGESEEAVTVWESLAAGGKRSVETLARLSEVFGGFGYDDRAAEAAAAADALDVKESGADPTAGTLEFADRMRFAELFVRAENAAAAETQIAKAEALAVTPEERRAVLNAAIDADEAAGKLAERIAALEQQAIDDPKEADVRLRLALYRDAAGDATGAANAAAEAVKLAPADPTALMTLSEMQERAGRVADAATTARRLADIDRQRRAEHLIRVAELQLRLGQRVEALRTAREVVAGAPGNPDGLAFLSRVAFRVGEEEIGLDALRRAARTAGRDPGPLLELASALADRFRTDEAVELLWRAFAAADGFDDKGLVVRRLAELARRQGRFAPFLEKLERTAAGPRGPRPGDEPDRETALLIAEAHLAADDPAAARGALEPLLSRDPKDTTLLARLATLAESAGEIDDAIAYQKRVVDLSEESAERMRLAGMLAASGDAEAAERFYLDLLGGTTDPVERVRAIDALLKAGREGLAFQLADAGLVRDGDDWELLVRLAAAAVNATGDEIDQRPVSITLDDEVDESEREGLPVSLPDVADAALRRVWELDLPHDTLSAAKQAEEERRRSRRAGSGGRTAGRTIGVGAMPAPIQRIRTASMGFGVLGLSGRPSTGMGAKLTIEPDDYGAARLLAEGWLAKRDPDFAKAVFADAGVLLPEESNEAAPAAAPPLFAEDATPTVEALWDAWFLASVGPQFEGVPAALNNRLPDLLQGLAMRLVRRDGAEPGTAYVYLQSLTQRSRNPSNGEQIEPDPLSDEELDLLTASLDRVKADGANAGMPPSYMERLLIQELKRAGKQEAADARVAELLAGAVEPDEISAAASVLASLEQSDAVLTLLERAAALPVKDRARAVPNAYTLGRIVGERTAAGDLKGAFAVLDAHADATAELAAQSSTGSSTAGRAQRLLIVRPDGNISQSSQGASFPPPAAPILDDQATLLYSQLRWLREPDQLKPLMKKSGGDSGEPVVGESGAEALTPWDDAPLIEHLKARAERPDAPHRWHDLLRLACLEAWDGDVDGAVDGLQRALEAAPENAALRRVTAAALIERGDAEAGLALLDAAEPADPDELRDRELLALRTAAQAGDLDRARAAAERLFGLRLDNGEQLELARSMQRLGLGDRAAAVLARVRRGGGNDATTLSGVMDLYRRRGDDEVAAEIARSILANVRAPQPQPGRGTTSAQREAESAREAAVRMLKEVGGLDPVLADLRAKLERNPNSKRVRSDLIGLLVAADRGDEAEALLKEDRPDGNDPGALYAAGQRLSRSGDSKAASEMYEKVIAADPSMIANDYYEVQRAFQQAERLPALMEAVGKTDPADWGGNSYAITNIISNALSNFDNQARSSQSPGDQSADDSADPKPNPAVAAFKSIWDRHPESRQMLFQSVHQGQLMGADGVYQFAVDELLGKTGRPGWDQLSNVRMWSTNPQSLTGLVLDAAQERGELQAFTERIAAEVKKHPDWHPGRGLLASAHSKAGNYDDARKEVETLLALPKDEQPSGQGAWLLSVHLGDDELSDLSLALMRRAVETNANTPYSGNGYEYSPQRRLNELLVKTGAKEEARQGLLKTVFEPDFSNQSFQSFSYNNPQYVARQNVQSWTGIGRQLAEMGYPLDALRVLSHAESEGVARAGMTSGSWDLRQLQDATKEVHKALTPAALADDLRSRLEAERAAIEAGNEPDAEPVLDLLLAATDGGDDIKDAKVTSGLIAALTAVPDGRQANGGDPFANGMVVRASPAIPVPAARVVPARAVPVKATSWSGLIATAVATLFSPQPAAAAPQVVVLEEVIEAQEDADPAPVDQAALAARLAELREALDEYATIRPNDASLHAAAAENVNENEGEDAAAESGPTPESIGAWWLTGIEAVQHPETREDGQALMDAALAAADELSDPAWRIAMRISAGSMAVERDDRAAAEKQWTKLLGDILDRDLSADGAPPGEAGAAAFPQILFPPAAFPPAAFPPAAFPTTGVRGALLVAMLAAPAEPNWEPDQERIIPVTTGPRARRALQLAKLAANRGLTELSLRAVRETLGGGAPLGGGSNSGPPGGMFGAPVVVNDSGGQPLQDSEAASDLAELSKSWKAAAADPAAVAATLTEIVLPTARPTEAFVYPGTSNVSNSPAPPVDALTPLLDWATRAEALGEIRERLATRSAAGSAGAAVDLLHVRLALATGETDGVAERLAKIAEDVSRGGTQADAEMAIHAALPALNAGVAPAPAYDALLAGASAVDGNGKVSHWYLTRLAREAFARGKPDAAQEFLADHLNATREQHRNFSGDYPVRQLRNATVDAIHELARGGAAVAALERIEDLDRLPTFDNQSGITRLDRNRLAADLARAFAAMPADDAFDALLAWTFPEPAPAGDQVADQQTAEIRGFAGTVPPDGPPAVFGRPADPARALSTATNRSPAPLTGTLFALAAAAEASGRTDELAFALDRADALRAKAQAKRDAAVQEKADATTAVENAKAELAAAAAQINATNNSRPAADGSLPAGADSDKTASMTDLPGTMRSTTLRLLAGLPADVPAGFAAAATLRTDLADKPVQNDASEYRQIAQQAFLANLSLTWAALGQPEHRTAAAADLAIAEPWGNQNGKIGDPFRPVILVLRTEAKALEAPAAPPLTNDFGMWRSAAPGSYATGPNARPPWVLLHGTAHATGPARANLLMFRYPLAGTFRLRVAANHGSRSESAPLYGGLIHEPFPHNHTYRARDLGGTRYAERPAPWLPSGPTQHYLFDISPDETVLRVGGRVVLTDPEPAPGSPFVGLAATDGRRCWFRTVEVTGEPTIPREVDLLAGDRFDGWFGPTGRNPEVRPGLETKNQSGPERWSAANGEAVGPATGERLVHHRPLFDGDRISFEFRTVGTVATAVPSLDRIGFVLDPEGVRLRFLPVRAMPGWFEEDGGLSAHATVPAPGALGAVPLIPNDWNTATLEADAERLTLSVNGTPVLERDLAAGADTPHGAAHPDRLFGLVASPGREARVRNVVLSGDWPDRLPETWKANLLLAPFLSQAEEDPLAAAELDDEARALAEAAGRRNVALVSHGQVSLGTWELLVAAAALPAEERFRLLAKFVLPLPVDPHWRTDMDYSPADPPPGTNLPGVENPTTGRRVPTGGKMVSPTAMLVDTAVELGRLDDLRAYALRTPGNVPLNEATRRSFLASIEARDGGDFGPHVAYLEQYAEGLTKDSEHWRAKSILIAARALADAFLADPQNEAARDAAQRLAWAYSQTFQNNFGGSWTLPKRHARAIRADTLGGKPLGAAWTVAPDASLIKAERGLPAARWTAASDSDASEEGADGAGVDHHAGGERDRLFAVRPAAAVDGDALTLSAQPSAGWFNIVHVLLGGLGAQLEATRDHANVRSLNEQRARPKLEKKVEGKTYDLTQTFGPAGFSAAIEQAGGEVWRTPAGGEKFDSPLPFVALQARGDHAGGVRALALTGDVNTPETVNLLPSGGRIPDWWLDAYGDENNARTTAGWTWKEDGLYGAAKSRGTSGGAFEETLLSFPRPLSAATETVRFEFHDQADADGADADGKKADRAGVHAALGRIAFVLTNDGVRVHPITAGPQDRVPHTADALIDEPANRRGPDALDLSSGQWRTVEMTVTAADPAGGAKADTLTLSLDGTVIYERPIAPANRRTFGLFRWSGDRATRVRNVTLTGDWADVPAAVPTEVPKKDDAP
ncbi:DUF1583 domain-containing protein [Alienimonas chondri]|uniref:Beta-barrel assembly-enhancing protease n=1 Tax=Alienimonas chondri TaxID=2681879 RepID=A0ABX1VBV5_9PLAN|nr:DUF1583 domain-containing protein [Alienimonas chondri]NNJ25410.1 Beta-barrel assembly-enhancing protease [Alienimonas chondri]